MNKNNQISLLRMTWVPIALNLVVLALIYALRNPHLLGGLASIGWHS